MSVWTLYQQKLATLPAKQAGNLEKRRKQLSNWTNFVGEENYILFVEFVAYDL